MATRVHGKEAQVEWVLTDPGGDGAELVGCTGWSLDIKAAADEITGLDSAGAKEFLDGLTEWSGTIGLVYDAVPADIVAGAELDLTLYTDKDNDIFYGGSAIVTSFKPTVSTDAVVKLDIDFQGTDELTYPVEPV